MKVVTFVLGGEVWDLCCNLSGKFSVVLNQSKLTSV